MDKMKHEIRMGIDRQVNQGDLTEALHRVNFVLNEIENLNFNVDEIFLKKIGSRLTYEEIIGALVSAEQILKKDYKEEYGEDIKCNN